MSKRKADEQSSKDGSDKKPKAESIDLTEDEVHVGITAMVGNFARCGGEWVFTESKGSTDTLLLTVSVRMPSSLHGQVDTVFISDGHDLKWSMWKPAQDFDVRLLLNKSLMGQHWTLVFNAAGKEHEQPAGAPVPPYALQTSETLRSIDLWVPAPASSGFCSICDMEIKQDEKSVILSCNHDFHLSCLFEQLREVDNVKTCTCGSSHIVTDCFPCPDCYTLIHEGATHADCCKQSLQSFTSKK
jgi:hypothetical protein